MSSEFDTGEVGESDEGQGWASGWLCCHEHRECEGCVSMGIDSLVAWALQAVDPYTERRIVLGGLSEHLSAIRRGRRIMFVGCGTSYHAAMACRQVAP